VSKASPRPKGALIVRTYAQLQPFVAAFAASSMGIHEQRPPQGGGRMLCT
jgi:hypothetical protein